MKDTTNSITRNINYAADHKNFIHKFGQKGITNYQNIVSPFLQYCNKSYHRVRG